MSRGRPVWWVATIAVSFSGGPAIAQSPLSIDQLLLGSERWQWVTSIDYRRSEPLPGLRQRSAQFTSSLRYGLSRRFELNARCAFAGRRDTLAWETDADSQQRCGVGANWLVKPETTTPAFLVEGRLGLHDGAGGESQALPGGQVAAVAYQTIDPLVLSVTLVADYQRARRHIGPSSAWTVLPQLNFAVNHRVTLIGGLRFSYQRAPAVEGQPRGPDSEQLALQLGMALAPLEGETFFLTAEFEPQHGSGITLQWLHDW